MPPIRPLQDVQEPTFCSVIEGLQALSSREMVGGASLNRWDQMAAYALCATFFDLLAGWPS